MRRQLWLGGWALLQLGGAAAQTTSVTMYGSLDAGPTRVSNVRGSAVTLIDDGVLQADRFGMRATEDLGGGMQAVAQLEGGFATSTGVQPRNGVLFNRLAFAGLSGRYGTVALGHHSNMMFDAVGKLSNGVQFGSFYAFHPGNFDETANVGQLDNGIKFTSREVNGLTLGAAYALGEQPGDASRNRAWGTNFTYANGPIRLGGAWTSANNKALNLGQSLGLRSLLGQTLITGTSTAPVFTPLQADNVRNTGLGASYALDGVLVHGAWVRSRVRTAAGDVAMTTPELGVNVRIGAAASVNTALSFSHMGAMHWNQAGVNYVYSLSRRTELYAMAIMQKANGAGAVAAINSLGYASGQRQTALRIGIHHLF
ncbi:porin [Pseudoduganella ginsengisoli]|uniref:Porin n=1 Tax=Pseudoduganella ginsengisoli TaxID=1462440 RepID=A0A6L6Q7V3_9BURK|nr:porin [Pseudoduganella ginsengisoli]MTW05298.1 porin [Pseudoduganella ginsengisoli]